MNTEEKRRIIDNWCYDFYTTQGSPGEWTGTITHSRNSAYFQETPRCSYANMIRYAYLAVRYHVKELVSVDD